MGLRVLVPLLLVLATPGVAQDGDDFRWKVRETTKFDMRWTFERRVRSGSSQRTERRTVEAGLAAFVVGQAIDPGSLRVTIRKASWLIDDPGYTLKLSYEPATSAEVKVERTVRGDENALAPMIGQQVTEMTAAFKKIYRLTVSGSPTMGTRGKTRGGRETWFSGHMYAGLFQGLYVSAMPRQMKAGHWKSERMMALSFKTKAPRPKWTGYRLRRIPGNRHIIGTGWARKTTSRGVESSSVQVQRGFVWSPLGYVARSKEEGLAVQQTRDKRTREYVTQALSIDPAGGARGKR